MAEIKEDDNESMEGTIQELEDSLFKNAKKRKWSTYDIFNFSE